MRTIGVVTVGRSDWGIYLPVVQSIRQRPELKLILFAGGMHLSQKHGLTIREIEKDGFVVNECVDTSLAGDAPVDIARSMGENLAGFAKAYERNRPDILVVLGDRFEMFAASAAAVPFNIPIAHIHGGDVTEGAIDNVFRHAISKMSHLHFVALQEHAKRLEQMGEEKWRIVVSGAPRLDAIRELPAFPKQEIQKRFELVGKKPLFLITYHPVTLGFENTEHQVTNLLGALVNVDGEFVFTAPNADTLNHLIRQRIEEFCKSRSNAHNLENAGQDNYLYLMSVADVMVGNSSSGILEAASFKLPVVNIGNRQAGRFRPENVIDCGYGAEDIMGAINKALSPSFRVSLNGLKNPYGDGCASDRIVERLASIALDPSFLAKRFNDLALDGVVLVS